MLKAIFNEIINSTRPHQIVTKFGEMVFQPTANEYLPVKEKNFTHDGRKREICNIESMVTVAKEEARRRDNKTGDHMTVIFNKTGANFFTDDKNRLNPDSWTYNRRNSRQLSILEKGLGSQMDHQGFLRLFQGLKPSIKNYETLFRAYRKTRASKTSQAISAPILQDGKMGAEFSMAFQVEGGNAGTPQNAAFPAEFAVEMPVVVGSQKKYEFGVEVDIWLQDKTLVWGIRCPELLTLIEQSVLDEIEFFRKETAELPDLCIVMDL